jgi:predicted NAD/FAD-dependent oxidoreductase
VTKLIAVVGAGAAGLVAATRLAEAGREVVVLEAEDRIGGRIHTVELAPGWTYDLGAHAFESDADHLIKLCEGFTTAEFSPWPWDTPDLVMAGGRYRSLFSDTGSLPPPPLPDGWSEAFARWIEPASESAFNDPVPDDHDAWSDLSGAVGETAADCIHSSIDHAVGWPLSELSALYVRNLIAWGGRVRLLSLAEGMAAPFLRLADRLDVRTGVSVTRVAPGVVEPFGAVDGAVVAVPAPEAAKLVAPGTRGRPSWLDEVPYSSEVWVAGFRRCDETTEWIDGVNVSARGQIARVTLVPAGQWFTPPGWQQGMVAPSRALAAELADKKIPDNEVVARLWELGRVFDDRLFPLEETEFNVVMRHRQAWPRWSAEHATRVATWRQEPPVVFAGDWTWHPFIEGAVRSGERASAVLLGQDPNEFP